MQKFSFRLFLFCGLLVTLVYGIDLLIQEGIKTSSYREISKWDEVIKGGIDVDILIVGSSRALVHFDPIQIEKKTGLTCYNLGLDGSKYEAQKKTLELYLQKNQIPKMIIWSLDFGSFQASEGIYRYEQFIPFWSEPSVKDILALNKEMDLDYLKYPIIRYSNNSAMKYRGLLAWAQIKPNQPQLEKGYRVSEKKWIGSSDEVLEKAAGDLEIGIEPDLFDDFKRLNQSLIGENIKIQWVISPYFKTAIEAISNRKRISDFLKNESQNMGVEFQDFSYSQTSLLKENFYNGSHMNKNGVLYFMNSLKF